MSELPIESSVVPVKRARRNLDIEPKTESSLEQMPNEIFLQIFALLNLCEFVNAFSGINKRYDSLLSSLKRVNLVITRNNNASMDKMLHQYAASITRLVVDRAPNFTFASMALTNVRSLTITYGTRAQYDGVRPCRFPILEYLHIDDYPNPDCKKSIYDLYQVVLANDFPQIRKCVATGPSFDSSEMSSWIGPSNLRSFRLTTETAHDFDMLLKACPYLHRIHVSCFDGQQQTRLSDLPLQTIVKHVELRCNHTSIPNIFLSRMPNTVKLKLAITAWPNHTLFEQLATGLKLSRLQVLTCLVAASQTADFPMNFETLNEDYIQNLHPLFKHVTIKQEDQEYCVDGDDVEWNKYDFKIRYSIHESVEIKSFI